MKEASFIIFIYLFFSITPFSLTNTKQQCTATYLPSREPSKKNDEGMKNTAEEVKTN